MCNIAIITFFSWKQWYPFLFTTGVISLHNLKKFTQGSFFFKNVQLFYSGGRGGVTILRWKMTPVNIYSMSVIILLYTDLSTQATHDFLYFNILWMIKYFLYHCWSMSAFYGYIEIFGLEVPWKHKNLMSLYLFHYKWISHDSFKTSWPVPLKALSEPYITYEFLSAWYLHLTVLLLIFIHLCNLEHCF